jgi:hypothetical protein
MLCEVLLEMPSVESELVHGYGSTDAAGRAGNEHPHAQQSHRLVDERQGAHRAAADRVLYPAA